MNRAISPGFLHASCIDWQGKGVLILGRSGSGKSGLALELISRGALLVGDDQVHVSTQNGQVIAHGAKVLTGRIEARYIGVISTTPIDRSQVYLIVDMNESEPERLPKERYISISGCKIRVIYGKSTPNLAAAIIVSLGAIG